MANLVNAANFPRGVAAALAETVKRACDSLVLLRSGRQGTGSGVVWRANGIIVTNHHVVARGHPVVTLADDREFRATIVASDPEVDLAVLQIDALGLPPVTVEDSSPLRVGQLVLAIGNPHGERRVATAGIISGLGVTTSGGRRGRIPYIRSDVGLAPGNSGGPLINSSGAVIGINAMVVGGDLGVAIPSNTVAGFVREALDRRVVLGVGVRAVPLGKAVGGQDTHEQGTGLMIVELVATGPAARAGLLPGDILLALGDRALDEPRALIRALLDYSPGATVPLALLRGGIPHTVVIELAPVERAA